MELHEIKNESGVFKIDENGILWEFVADKTNIIGDRTYKSLIIPNEVRGFSDGFGRGITVVDKFQLPCTLWDMGVYMTDWANAGREYGCVFANSKLPRVLLPEEILSDSSGMFAFGNAYIHELCIPESYDVDKWSARTFKGCIIDKLYIPEKFRNKDDNYKLEPFFCSIHGIYFDSVDVKEIYIYSKREVGDFPTDEYSTLVAKQTQTKYN